MEKIEKAALISGAGGVALFGFMFLGWFGDSEANSSVNAWESFEVIDLVLLVAIILSVGTAAVTLTRASVSVPPAGYTMTAVVGALAFVLVLYRLVDPPGSGDVDREIGIWLGLAATAGIAAGGHLGMQEEGPLDGAPPPEVPPPSV